MSRLNEPHDIAVELAHAAPCPICRSATSLVEPEESDPTMDVLEDQSVDQGASITLGVSYHANSPVTIIWRIDSMEISRQNGRIPHGQTHATLNRFTPNHQGKKYEVVIIDNQERNVSTSCRLNMRR